MTEKFSFEALREDIAATRVKMRQALAASDKSAAVGCLYMLAVNTGSFLTSYGKNFDIGRERKLCQGLVDAFSAVGNLPGELDADDEYVLSEATDHITQIVNESNVPELANWTPGDHAAPVPTPAPAPGKFTL